LLLKRSAVDTGAGPSLPMTDRVQVGMESPTAIVIVSLHFFGGKPAA
jgi:hypothetical protein